MALQPFEYIPTDTLKTAEALLREHGERAAALAGGTDLLGALKDAVHADPPALLIGLKPLADLRYVKAEPTGVRIGALTTLAEIASHPEIRQTYPLLAAAAASVASPQIRNVATIAGNLCQEPRCWYYRNPDNTFDCLRKGGRWCDALFAENRYHSIFGGMCVSAAPCAAGCPIHNDIPAYMAELRAGETEAAVAILLRTNPLAAIMGRACAHYCEENCNRFAYDEPVSIRDVERALGDYALAHADRFYRPPATETGQRVAVVGAGPAGLTAAYFLRQAGHDVTVFDRMPQAGGMLTYSIPAYRLPKTVVQAQIAALAGMGIRFELSVPIGIGSEGLTLADLRARYGSVFLATGLWNGKKLRLERGELLDSGLEFLINVQAGVPQTVGERVLVIGGGSVAMDVAITARRMGARQVTLACLESLAAMPAIPEDIEQAHEEDITILPSWGPQRVLERDGKLAGMEFVRCTAVFDDEGRFAPAFDPAVTTVVAADQILVAIGQSADLSYIDFRSGRSPTEPGERSLSSGRSPTEPGEPSLSSGRSPTEPGEPSLSSGRSPTEPGEPSLSSGRSPTEPGEPSLSSGRSPTEPGEPSLKTERGFIVSDKTSGATSLAGVFAGGDVTGGPATVVQAMAAGRRAAAAIDAYLAGTKLEAAPAHKGQIRLVLNEDALTASGRVPTPRLPVPQRTLRGEDSATLAWEAMASEPFRCANCGCVAVNASDLAPALIALDAQVKTTRRTLPAEALFAAALSKTTVLETDELIEEIEIPAPPPGNRQRYLKFRIRNAIDFPIVGVAFRVTVEGGRFHDARVVLGAVAPVPLRAHAVEVLLEGQAPGVALADAAAALAVREAQPLARNRAKVEVVKALVRQAILAGVPDTF